ncbi:MAG: methyltransferase domain-containing protein [Deltaproteobacteria bacterium]|nr:methyltransferase domain-containing protein [Deltaproteobacteria bacterium]
MSNFENIKQIDKRYSKLATTSCCLSCGGAINYAKPQKGEVCVDLGSGRGTDVIRMAEDVGLEGFAYGVDTSSGMLSKARKTAEKTGVENVKFIDSTFEKINLDSNIANLIISNCSINHADDKDAVWAEVFRILKPGGRFVVSDIYSTSEVPAKYRNDPEAVAECWAGSVEKNIYLDTLENTGFMDINILEESEPYPKGAIEVASFTITGKKPL